MGFTILPLTSPSPAAPHLHQNQLSDANIANGGDIDLPDADADAVDDDDRPVKLTSRSAIVTPGETITDDPQWMR